jgi:alpha-beta hydrolase superfamily lysophospholipase
MATETTGFIERPKGPKLFFRHIECSDPRARLVFLHGYGDHSGRYVDHFFCDLADRGIDVWALDVRGHGRSEGITVHCDSFADYHDDLRELLARVPENSKRVPLYLAGHSFGGLITASFLAVTEDAFAGGILLSPFLGFAQQVPWYMRAIGLVASRTTPTLTMPNGIPFEALCSSKSEHEKLRTDKLFHSVATSRWFTETLKAQKAIAQNASKIRYPLLLLAAGDDRVASVGASSQFYSRVSSVDKKWVEFPGQQHELLFEPAYGKTVDALTAWVFRRA